MLGYILNFVDDPTQPAWQGYMYTIVMLLAAQLQSILMHQVSFLIDKYAIRAKEWVLLALRNRKNLINIRSNSIFIASSKLHLEFDPRQSLPYSVRRWSWVTMQGKAVLLARWSTWSQWMHRYCEFEKKNKKKISSLAMLFRDFLTWIHGSTWYGRPHCKLSYACCCYGSSLVSHPWQALVSWY